MAELEKSSSHALQKEPSKIKTEDFVLNAISDWKLTREEANSILERFKCEREKLEQNYNSCKIDISNDTANKLLKLANESWFTQIVEKLKEKLVTSEKLEETSFWYFWITFEEFRDIQDTFEKYSFDFDFKNFLEWYKNYIEKNLLWLEQNIIEKIKLAIKIKFLQVTKILEERVAFVDEQIKNWNINISDREKEIKNQRWIIDEKLQDNFSNINNSVLPSAWLLLKHLKWESIDKKSSMQIWSRKWYSNSVDLEIIQAKKMFETNVDENWDFKNSKLNPSFTQNRLIDLRRNYDSKFAEDNDIGIWKIPSILNEQDKEIKEKAEMAYIAWLLVMVWIDWLAFTWVWTWFSAIVWWTYSAIDAFTSEDFLLTMIKETWYIPDDFKAEKKWYDNALALLWIVPLAWEVLRLSKNTPKIAKFLSKLSPEKLALFNKMKAQISDKVDKKIAELSGRFWSSKEVEWDDLVTKMSKVEEKTWIQKEEVISNSKWYEEWKFDLPNDILIKNWEKSLTPEQLEVVKKVHLEISKWLYQNSTSDIMKMTRVMREAWINENQTRILMENWITGKFWFLRRTVEETTSFLDRINLSKSDNKVIRFASNPDMEPKYQKIINWQEFLFTDRMSNWWRNYVFWYVKVWDKYEQRIFYFSQSWWNWHSCPWIRVEDGWYSKWEFAGLSYEKWTIVNQEISDFFETLQVKNIWYDLIDFLKDIFWEVSTNSRKKYHSDSMEWKFLSENRVTTLNDGLFAHIDRNTSIQWINQIMRNIDVSSIDLNWLIKIWESTQSHMWLWEVNIQRYRTTMRWRPIEIQYASTSSEPNKMWIENIFYADTHMNSYWLPTDSINAWLLTTKPLEYISQVAREISISWAKQFQWYIDIRDFIQENPLIRYFKSMYKENPNVQKYNQSELIKWKKITTESYNLWEWKEISLRLWREWNVKITKFEWEYYYYSEWWKSFKLERWTSVIVWRETNPYLNVWYEDVSRNHLSISCDRNWILTIQDHSTYWTFLNNFSQILNFFFT